MKKLHILIPGLIATISMPLVGLVGCNKTINEDDYKIDETKFEQIIGMEGVEYLQADLKLETSFHIPDQQVTLEETRYSEMSPSVSHKIETMIDMGVEQFYTEEYVWNENDEYIGVVRFSKDDDFSDPITLTESYFTTPQKIGRGIVEIYETLEEQPSFNSDKLCYELAFSEEDDEGHADNLFDFYFYKNKFVKLYMNSFFEFSEEGYSQETTETYNFEYKNYDPPLPVIYSN